MTKNRSMKIAVLVLALALLTSCFIGSTFAKYTSNGTGTATANVAEWSFTVGDVTDVATSSEAFTFDLFAQTNRKDSDGTSGETDVAEGDIAPGTSGSFAITLKNTSDVNAEYTVAFTLNNPTADHDNDPGTAAVSIPLQFKVGDGEWGTSLTNVAATAIAMGATGTVNVQWKWAFLETAEANAIDTYFGINTPTVTVNAVVTVSQVD